MAEPDPNAVDSPQPLQRLYRWRPGILLALALVAAGAMWSLQDLVLDFTPQKIFESGTHGYAELVEVQEIFGRDDSLFVIHVATDDVFTSEFVSYLRELQTNLRQVPGVLGVEDLTTAAVVRPGQPLPTPVFPAELTDASLAEARQLALAEPLLRGRVVSANGKAALVVVRLDPNRTDYLELSPLVKDCLDRIERTAHPPGVVTSPTGIPLARVFIVDRLIKDQMIFLPTCTVLFVLILWGIFRDVRAVIVPLAAVGVSLLYTVGLLATTGEEINIVNQVLSTLILVIGVSDAIHLIARYRRELVAGLPQRQALDVTMRHLTVACLFTSLTTAVGFASLGVADIRILQRFGFYAAGGVMIAYVVTIVFVPLVFSYLSPIVHDKAQQADARADRAAAWLAQTTIKHRWGIAIGTVILVVACVFGALRLEVESNVFEAFPTDDPVVQSNLLIERDFGGPVPLSLVVSWDEGDPLRPEVLRYLDELHVFMVAQDGLANPLSVVDLVKSWNYTRHRGDAEERRVPDTEGECKQAVLTVAMAVQGTEREGLLTRIYAPTQKRLRIAAQTHDVGSTQLAVIYGAIRERLKADRARHEELGIACMLTGEGPVAGAGIDTLIRDMLASLFTALAIIFPTMVLLLRSFKAALVSMIPNAFPLLLTMGFMAAMDMDLRVTSVLVFTISFGLAVDDTIHFMARFREEWLEHPPDFGGGSYEVALQRTFVGTGNAIVTTTLLLGGGIGALLFSSFPLTRTFALGMEVTIVGALIGDLVVLPAFLEILKPFGSKG
ncbi:efflux RND transporter permease subunit [Planctomycetota bacterium]|nr:efflux RND transporter permease subunit [Planctomycetota bacterium]